MRVWLVQPSEQLPLGGDTRKLRTRLLAEELASSGHQVVWWASCFNHLRKSWYFTADTTFEPMPNVVIHAIKGVGYKRNVSLRRWLDHRIVNRKFRVWAAREPNPDVVITSLPPHDLAASAVSYARECGAIAIVDVRDKWPDNLIDVVPRPLRPLARAILHGDYADRDSALKGADVLLSMTDPLLEWALRAAGRRRLRDDQVFYLGAYREPNATAPSQLSDLVRERLRDRYVVAFIGTFSTYHNPTAMIEAARLLKHRSDIAFVLAGDGDHRAALHEQAAKLPNVLFTGWLDSAAITFLLRNSDLGLCTSGKLSERNFLPNKVFAYLAEGLPIGSVFDGELRDLINREGIGFNFSSPQELAFAIESLASNPARQEAMRASARAFFDLKCDALTIYRRYAELVETLVRRKATVSPIPEQTTSNG
ncbi:MAG: glycosyltransferase family 4 protein [Gammaproteobacteria bacterium]|nr:glycosyltransferase family 4 protein [Gammaproteobacteria bacterium]